VLLTGFRDLHKAMLATVTGARECLVLMGSRSRDETYLQQTETVLAERPALVYYRVLFGPPHHLVLKQHLLALLRLRDPQDRSLGIKTLHLGMVAVVPIPSLTSHEAFDSGIVLGAAAATRLLDHGRQAYAAARRIETAEDVTTLEVLRERSARI
jgi:hypothetical protein